MSASTPPIQPGSSTQAITTTAVEAETDQSTQHREALTEPNAGAQLFPRGEDRGQEISATGVGRKSIPDPNYVSVFGTKIARAGAPIEVPKNIENGIASLLGGLFANRGPLADGPRIVDYRNAEAVGEAMQAQLVAPNDALGPLTIYRPGLGNTAPGPAQIARLAQYTDRLIIAFANPGRGAETQLRPVTEVDGVPLPAELRGKVFAIGSPKNVMISFEQGSDLFLEQLDAMSKSPLMSGTDLRTAGATVVAHSQGGLDAVLTRKRLIDAGFDGVIGKLGTEASPFGGSPVSDQSMFGIFAGLGEKLFDLQAMGAVKKLDPDYVKEKIPRTLQNLVDVALIGHTDTGGHRNIRTFFTISENAIEGVKSVAGLFKGPDVRENDGLVTIASQLFGKIQHRLTRSYDHAGIAEDPRVADEMVRRLYAA